MIDNILSTKIKIKSENKKKQFELLSLSQNNDSDNDDNLKNNLIINESDDDTKTENFNLKFAIKYVILSKN